MNNIFVIETLYASPEFLQEIFNLVQSGGQVRLDDTILQKQISRTRYIAVYIDGGAIKACAAIKRPQKKYLEKVFTKTDQLPILGRYYFELGYCVTLPDYRGKGIGESLVRQLELKMSAYNLWATTHTEAMKHIFKKRGWTGMGQYLSDNNEKIELWVN